MRHPSADIKYFLTYNFETSINNSMLLALPAAQVLAQNSKFSVGQIFKYQNVICTM